MTSLDTKIRRAMLAVVAIVAAASAMLSYAGLAALGREAGLGTDSLDLFVLLPIAVDGTVLAGMLGVLHSSVARTSPLYSWCLVLGGLGVSIWGNASVAATPSDKVVHAIAPVALALSLEALTASLRRRVVDEHAEAERLAQEAAAEVARIAREEAAQQRAERRAGQAAKPRQTASRVPSRPRSTGKHDPETVAEVVRLRAAGASYREIEEATGVSKSRVGALLAQQPETQPVVRDDSEESAA